MAYLMDRMIGPVGEWRCEDGEEGFGGDDDRGESVRLEDLPPAEYTGPIDFKFVKDANRLPFVGRLRTLPRALPRRWMTGTAVSG